MNKEAHHSRVNEELGFPLGEQFERDLIALMSEDAPNYGQSVVIAIIDCDNFMHINTDFGYDVGDQILIQTGKHFEQSLPARTKIYRIAGDEFGIIFEDYEREEVFLLLEGIRKAYAVKAPDGEALSVSIGLASFDDANRYQELVRKAESAMFRAKYNGKNKIALAKEEKMVPKTSHYTQDQLNELNKLSKKEGIGEAVLLREALDMLLKKYDR